MLRNPEAAQFFSSLQAHSDVAAELLAALGKLGEFEHRHGEAHYAAPYIVTAGVVFCGAAGMSDTYWRLRGKDIEIALATGATRAPIGPEWVVIRLFRADWPRADLPFWALRAYDYARTGE
jgi:hypothetical protein